MKSKSGKWQVGDKIDNRFQVYQILGGEGKSGMGIVYVCYDNLHRMPFALKTFQERYILSEKTRQLFKREALLWTELEKHPYIVRANWVDILEGSLFIVLEYIAPDRYGRNTLAHYLENLTYTEILKLSIQFCYGMEHSYSKGIDAHRDIKPDNIMITPDKTVKITDFGLAKAFSEIEIKENIIPGDGRTGLSIFRSKGKGICGTLPWMSPEQFDGFADQRSDIYSFGVVMYQMAAKGKLPFEGNNQQDYENLHKYEKVNLLSHPLCPIVKKCLEKEPEERFQNFASIREDIQNLLIKETGENIRPPKIGKELESWELYNKALALANLDRYGEAISCYDKVLEIDPKDTEVLSNKGRAFFKLSRHDAAISCYDEALEIDPNSAEALAEKGAVLADLGRYEEAISCYDKALSINLRLAIAWYNKGLALYDLGRYEEAISCYNKAFEINPRDAKPLNNKGFTLISLGRYNEAISFIDKAIEINPAYALAYVNKGLSLENLRRDEDALSCYNKALDIDPKEAKAWNNKGSVLGRFGRYKEAIFCFDKALEINPNFGFALRNKGIALFQLGRNEEAISFFDKSLVINPNNVSILIGKAGVLANLGRYSEALKYTEKVIEINPNFPQAHQLKQFLLQNLER